MNFLLQRRHYAAFVLAWLLCGLGVHAQSFGIIVTNQPAPVSVNGTLIYTYAVTNMTGIGLGSTFPVVQVTNTFSANITVLTASNSYSTNNYVVTTNGNTLIYNFFVFSNNDTAFFSFAVQPLTAGLLTNTISVGPLSTIVTNVTTTNIVVQVFSGTSDLGVFLAPPIQTVITNDLVTYTVTATNFGPQSASGVLLTNTLPPGVTLKSASPSNPGLSGSNMVFNLGTLAANAGQTFTIAIQPTNIETATLSASIGAPSIQETTTTNNFASTNIVVTNYLAGVVIAFTNSGQSANLQNGAAEQSIIVSNADVVDVPAVRLVVTGLTNQLFNAVGTNNGSPFVYLSAPLAPGQTSPLRLQYMSRKFFPFTNGQLHAFAVPMPNWTPPWLGASNSMKTNINFLQTGVLTNGDVVLGFAATAGKTYTIIYSGDPSFSNAMIAPPSIVAPANIVQWDDYGPPATTNRPSASSMRFYRVYQNP